MSIISILKLTCLWMILIRVRDYRYYSISKYIKPVIHILYHSHSEQLIHIHISVLSKLRESAEISAVRFTNLNFHSMCICDRPCFFTIDREPHTHKHSAYSCFTKEHSNTHTKKMGGKGVQTTWTNKNDPLFFI